MKVWVTKNALTLGIKEMDAERCSNINNEMIEILGSSNEFYFDEGDEWHLTKESAIRKANDMRFEKIVSLNERIKELEDMDFK